MPVHTTDAFLLNLCHVAISVGSCGGPLAVETSSRELVTCPVTEGDRPDLNCAREQRCPAGLRVTLAVVVKGAEAATLHSLSAGG
jgi:hypothetical protein